MLVAESGLSQAIFDSPYAEAAFDEIVSKQTAELTKFGQAILQSKRLPDKVAQSPLLPLPPPPVLPPFLGSSYVTSPVHCGIEV